MEDEEGEGEYPDQYVELMVLSGTNWGWMEPVTNLILSVTSSEVSRYNLD